MCIVPPYLEPTNPGITPPWLVHPIRILPMPEEPSMPKPRPLGWTPFDHITNANGGMMRERTRNDGYEHTTPNSAEETAAKRETVRAWVAYREEQDKLKASR